MNGFYGHKRIGATFTTATTVSTALNVEGWNHVAIEVPTFAVGVTTATANVYIQACQTEDGTFRRIRELGVYSAASGIQNWEIPSSIGNYIAVCRPAERFNYIKVELSNTTTATFGCYVHVHN